MKKFKISPDEYKLICENAIKMSDKLVFTPKSDATKKLHININKINIINNNMIDSVIKRKIDLQLQKLIDATMLFLNDDDEETSSEHLMHALDEAARFKAMLDYKYQKYLDHQFEKENQEKLNTIMEELKNKRIYSYHDVYEEEYVEDYTQGKSR